MVTILVIFFCLTVLAVVAETALLGYLYGVRQSQARVIVQMARDAGRAKAEIRMWQSKVFERVGAGQLFKATHVADGSPAKNGRRFSSASEVVRELRNRDAQGIPFKQHSPEIVPAAITAPFLAAIT